jgi:tetratricopeptide (TPR) repeat protein
MASGGERRMLFDIRGKRKHVVRVVYAILALLMGASLFLVVGPVNIGALVGNSTSSNNSAQIYEERAENIERELRKTPDDETLLLALSRARLGAGNALVEVDPATRQPIVTSEARAEFEKGTQAWDRYLKQAKGEPNPAVALSVARTFFALAASSSEYEEVFESLDQAAGAQRVAVAAKPSVNSLTVLAEFEYLAGNFDAAAKITSKAEALAPSKSTKKAIAKLAKEKEKIGKELQKSAKAAAKAEKGKAKEQLENPLGGLGGG